MCKKIKDEHEDIRAEIGIFFLCDSLGKTDIRIFPEQYTSHLEYGNAIEKVIRERGLPKQLKLGYLQLPMSINLAEIYLKYALK